MARIKIIGHEKCPHVNKKSGKNCNKRGRYNLKPMISWNSKLNFDNYRKRQYFQFIHNDGTRHNISTSSSSTISKKELRLYNTIVKAWLTTGWPLMLKPTQREDMLSELAAGNKGPIIKSFKEYESQRKRETYWRSKGLHEELYSNTHSLVDNEYKAIKELVEIGTETPASDKLWLSGLSRVLPPETVRKIIDEKMKKLKGLSLLRNDIENDREILEKIFSEP